MKTVVCPHCSNEVTFEDHQLGKRALCPYCQKPFVPPLKHSGPGVSAFLLGLLTIGLTGGYIAYSIMQPPWELGFLSNRLINVLIGLVMVLSIVLSWMSIGMAIWGYKQKRRRKWFCKWGLIFSIVPTVLIAGFAIVRPFLPEASAAPEDNTEEVQEEETPPEE